MNEIKIERMTYSALINSTFKKWTGDTSDMVIISAEGHKIYTQKFLLAFYGSYIATLPDFMQENVGLFIDASSKSIISLLKILSSGLAVSEVKDDLLDVVEVAKCLGITLDNWQIGSRKVSQTKKQNVIQKVEKNDLLRDKPCSICGERFETEENVEDHTITHFNISNSCEKCDGCHLYFSEYKYLAAHINLHHSESRDILLKTVVKDKEEYIIMQPKKPLNRISDWSCAMCGNKYSNGTALRRHMVIHTGLRFECKQCGKGFIRKDSLSKHLRVKHSAKNENFISNIDKTIALYQEYGEPVDRKKSKKTFDTVLEPRM